MTQYALLVLEDGTIFQGKSIGYNGITIGEIVFNTSMTGYQEILTDPSYKNQIITFTYPHIGNTGINKYDTESNHIQVKGIIIRDISLSNNHCDSIYNLSEYLKYHHIIGISNLDTRKITRIIRNQGTQYGCIITKYNFSLAYKYTKNFYEHKNMYLVQTSNKKKIYHWTPTKNITIKKTIKNKKKLFHIIVYDFGIKNSILQILSKHGCYFTIVPSDTSYKKILHLQPDGIILSNGPGDPRFYNNAITNIKNIIRINIPTFGICLGHQLLALSQGAKIIKMKFGHHGSNHPVQNIQTKQVMITTQNHNFTIDHKNIPNNIHITHISLFDKTIQGIQIINKSAFSFQGHPESSPGPHDAKPLFNTFINYIINTPKLY
ncbi:glutamine-hydrolyzing carbamoyl-phosphate synthase small subunit [Buchnera aphidicola]|uniref:Carbamoyl phosphate synthase small chain n=1 Tax=Buchnera aphidicola (Stegophylla sp.) TaxID=2315800 RepID=A0A4D6Y8L7_9GAMM|nr:glutamine-hydrolyzing carbamoyl-phosphate synthase small subunit [Buchnera aphidicola (Stegophylla sp.)]QCI26286.1 carbamoyl-phosphate synthase small subunit [Buchnera aphidicola (Stegophylla sp.)]